MKTVCLGEMVRVKINAQAIRKFNDIFVDLQPGGKHHHVECFFRKVSIIIHVTHQKIVCPGQCIHGMNPGPDKLNAFCFCVFIVTVKILPVGPHIHEEDSAIQGNLAMLPGNDRLF